MRDCPAVRLFTLLRQEALWLATGGNGILGFAGFRKDAPRLAAGCFIDIADAASGTVDHAVPIVREIIHAALQKFAKSIICAHNHPGANITPSTQDKTFTKELSAAGKLMGIKVLDHVIIGDNEFYSFADEGLMV